MRRGFLKKLDPLLFLIMINENNIPSRTFTNAWTTPHHTNQGKTAASYIMHIIMSQTKSSANRKKCAEIKFKIIKIVNYERIQIVQNLLEMVIR